MSLLHRTRSTADDLPELTPAQLAELDALDAAIAGDEIADDALAAMVRDVRAAAPELRPEVARDLGVRVAAGFDPSKIGAQGEAARPPRSRGLVARFPGQRLGIAATILISASLAVGALAIWDQGTIQTSRPLSDDIVKKMDGAPASPDAGGHADPAVVQSAPPAPAAAAAGPAIDELENRFDRQSGAVPSSKLSKQLTDTAQALPRDPGELGPQSLDATSADAADRSRSTGRAVERTVDMAVRVEHDGLAKATAAVQRITREANGYVATSDVALAEGAAGTARFELRVDSARLDRALERLASLGTVTSQTQSARDITSAPDGATARLQDATQERAALLRALAKATGAGEIAALRTRIAENRRLRARLDAQLQQVQRRADLTTISLGLTAPTKDDPTASDDGWSLGDAAGDAWSALRTILGVLLIAAAVALPFALLAALGWALWSARRRAARERALDHQATSRSVSQPEGSAGDA